MPGSYLLSSVLAGCLKASKESRGLKVGPSMLCFLGGAEVRFNAQGVMSNQPLAT